MRILGLIILLCITSFTVQAQRTGNDIINSCVHIFNMDTATPQQAFAGLECSGYVAGLNDMAVLMFGLTDNHFYCPPEKQGLETGQVIRVYMKWLEEHPDALHESSRSLFISAMKQAFPCN